jgi:hypothetical protein
MPADGIAAAAEGSLRRLMAAVAEVVTEGQGLRYTSGGQHQDSGTPATRSVSNEGSSNPSRWWGSRPSSQTSSLLKPLGFGFSQGAGKCQGWSSMLEPIYEGSSVLGANTLSSEHGSTLPLPLGLHSAASDY